MSIVGILPDGMPGDRVTIFDQSGYQTSAPTTELNDPIAFFAFVSPKGKGPDKTLVPITGANVVDYGTPNFSKWGVSLYNVRNYIKGGGSVLGMRVVADNAGLANVGVVAKYKVVANQQATDDQGQPLYTDALGNISTTAAGNTPLVRDVLKVLITTSSFSLVNAVSPQAIGDALDELKNDEVDTDGYKILPLFAVYEKSAGLFGNNVAFRISYDATMESQEEGNRFYKLSATDTSTNSPLTDPVTFTLNPEYLYNGIESMFLPDVMEAYNEHLGAYVSPHFNTFRDIVTSNSVYSEDGEDTVNDIDVLFGLTKTSGNHYKYEIDPESVALSSTTGITLAGGSDGDFDASNAGRAAAISAAMVKAYNGTYTDGIFDELRFPFIHVFDNDDSQLVKDAVSQLCDRRYTSIAVLSAPPSLTTYTQMDALRGSQFKYNSFGSAWYTESAMVIDPYTSKRVRMPASYFNSFEMANHCKNKGFGIPFAGKFYTWSGFIPGTMLPQSTSQDILKTQHNNRVNQMFEDGRGSARPYQQITMQSTMSKLSELNNVHILKMMVRIALQEADDARWDFNAPTDIVNFQKTVTDAIDLRLNGLYDSVGIECTKESANGAGASRIKAAITVNFKDVLKGVTFQFYIN